MQPVFLIIIIILVAANTWTFSNYLKYRSRVKLRGFMKDWPVPPISLTDVDPIFETNIWGPTLKSEVTFVGKGNLPVPGGTSDAEAWILAALSKNAKSIFEFGTCTGKTTYLMAVNSGAEATVTTITLSPEQVAEYDKQSSDDKKAIDDALLESAFEKFLYTSTPAEKKVVQLYGDSKTFDHSPYRRKFDLIFIDGSHAYSYVLSDTAKAMEMVAPGGIILWHDYRGPRETKDVYRALNELSSKYPLSHIRDTSLVFFRNKV